MASAVIALGLMPRGSGGGWGLGPALLCTALGVLACGSDSPDDDADPTGSGGGSGGAPGACQFNEEVHPGATFGHLLPCTPVSFDTNPPSGGTHYSSWAAYRNYDFAAPPGFLVHSLEHGAVVFWYNCPNGCADEVAEAVAMIDALPEDDLCAGTGTPRRAILVPLPELDARWAASSWGFLTKADCFDAEALSGFYTAHVGQGREQLCNPGVVLTANVCP